jgi:putative DNA methylase
MAARLMAIVIEGDGGRVYLPPTQEMEEAARNAQQKWKPDLPMPNNPRWFSPPLYGLKTFGDLFTQRQLLAMTTFSDLAREARGLVECDALTTDLSEDRNSLAAGGAGATAYADAVALYLAFAVDKGANYWSSVCAWHNGAQKMISTFGR